MAVSSTVAVGSLTSRPLLRVRGDVNDDVATDELGLMIGDDDDQDEKEDWVVLTSVAVKGAAPV